MLTNEEQLKIEDQLSFMVEDIDDDLLSQMMNNEERLNYLRNYVNQFASTHLEGYAVNVRLLSANFNKVFSVKISKLDENGAPSYDDECSYCILLENPMHFPEPAIRRKLGQEDLHTVHGTNKVEGNLATIYASKIGKDVNNNNLRVSLIPFYNNCLGNIVKYESYMGQEMPPEIKRQYGHQYGLRVIQNRYLKSHNKIYDISAQDFDSRSKQYRKLSYDSIKAAEKILSDESLAMLKKNKKISKRVGAFFRAPSSELSFEPQFQEHAKIYFESLVNDIMSLLSEEVEHQIDDQARRLGIPYEQVDRAPYGKYLAAQRASLEKLYKKGEHIVSTPVEVDEAMRLFNKFLEDSIAQAQIQNFSLIEQEQQSALLPAIISVLDTGVNFTENNILLYDWKVDNILWDSHPVIADSKTLCSLDETSTVIH